MKLQILKGRAHKLRQNPIKMQQKASKSSIKIYDSMEKAFKTFTQHWNNSDFKQVQLSSLAAERFSMPEKMCNF